MLNWCGGWDLNSRGAKEPLNSSELLYLRRAYASDNERQKEVGRKKGYQRSAKDNGDVNADFEKWMEKVVRAGLTMGRRKT